MGFPFPVSRVQNNLKNHGLDETTSRPEAKVQGVLVKEEITIPEKTYEIRETPSHTNSSPAESNPGVPIKTFHNLTLTCSPAHVEFNLSCL
jgi:hypothetical protein